MTHTNPGFQKTNQSRSKAFLSHFQGALAELDNTARLGKELARRGIRRLVFVGCGAPHFMMRVLAYWARRYALTLEVRTYFSAEFIHQDPRALDEKTLVVLGSHSGKTAETIAAAEFLADKSCVSVAITQDVDSPLGRCVDQVVAYGPSEQGYYSSFLLGEMLISALLDQLESEWKLHDLLGRSLPLLPAALEEVKTVNQARAAAQAEMLADEPILYVIGAGPMFSTAYTFASCFLMEMLQMHAHPLVAAEFFHGPFEVVDGTTSLLVLLGEDPGRPEAERAARFSHKYAGRCLVYDSEDYLVRQIPSRVRPIFSTFLVDAALTALVEQLSRVCEHPLTERRYMGKVDY